MNDLRMVQVGWRSRITGVICECPVYERSPHANSDPVFVLTERAPVSSRDIEAPSQSGRQLQSEGDR